MYVTTIGRPFPRRLFRLFRPSRLFLVDVDTAVSIDRYSRFVSLRSFSFSGIAPQQPDYRREMRHQEDVGARGGNTSGPRKRPAGNEPPALTKSLVAPQKG